METPLPTATPAPAREVRPSRDRTRPVVLTADISVGGGLEVCIARRHQSTHKEHYLEKMKILAGSSLISCPRLESRVQAVHDLLS
jgi:hypothetical protein